MIVDKAFEAVMENESVAVEYKVRTFLISVEKRNSTYQQKKDFWAGTVSGSRENMVSSSSFCSLTKESN